MTKITLYWCTDCGRTETFAMISCYVCGSSQIDHDEYEIDEEIGYLLGVL